MTAQRACQFQNCQRMPYSRRCVRQQIAVHLFHSRGRHSGVGIEEDRRIEDVELDPADDRVAEDRRDRHSGRRAIRRHSAVGKMHVLPILVRDAGNEPEVLGRKALQPLRVDVELLVRLQLRTIIARRCSSAPPRCSRRCRARSCPRTVANGPVAAIVGCVRVRSCRTRSAPAPPPARVARCRPRPTPGGSGCPPRVARKARPRRRTRCRRVAVQPCPQPRRTSSGVNRAVASSVELLSAPRRSAYSESASSRCSKLARTSVALTPPVCSL